MQASAAIIFNGRSGGGHAPGAAERLVAAFAAHGVEADVFAMEGRRGAAALARDALEAGHRLVVAAGGDGTAGGVASAVAGTEAALGVLPLGTRNHFAKDLGLPGDVAAAVRVIAAGRVARVDVGEVNGRLFLNNASLGFYPAVVRYRRRQQERLGRGRWPAFLWATLTALRRYPFLDVRLGGGEVELHRKTPFVFVGNNEYELAGFHIGKRWRLDAGTLCLYVAHRPTRIGLLRLAVSALLGRARRVENFDVLLSDEFWVETRRRRLTVATDGELHLLDAPLSFRTRPAALRVLVPGP